MFNSWAASECSVLSSTETFTVLYSSAGTYSTMYRQLITLRLIATLVSFIPVNYGDLCIDAKRTLRCVLPQNCPNRRVVDALECPSTRVCCRNFRPSVYLSMRSSGTSRTLNDPKRSTRTSKVTASSTPSTTTRRTTEAQSYYGKPLNIDPSDFDSETIVFPNDFGDYSSHETEKPEILGETRYQNDGIDSELEGKQLLEKSKSDYYCEEYAKLTIEYAQVTHLNPKARRENIPIDICRPSFAPLIVGGTNANVGEYPHMAALGYNKSYGIDYICGGTLISENFILTAAHCANTKWGPPVEAFLGDLKLRSEAGVTVRIVQTIVHPGYEPPSLYHDIALLRLDRKLSLSLDLRPACLSSRLDEKRQALESPGTVTIATGWGRTGVIGESSETLQKVRLEVMDNKKCNEFYEADSRTDKLRNGITSNLICAGGRNRGYQDTCQGDSGGPLQAFIPGKKCVIEVLGVTSFGKSCGAGVPGVYTKVSPYVSWIENHVWP